MIVKTHSKLVGAGLYAKHLCTQAQQMRTTVNGRRRRRSVEVFVKKHILI